MFYLQKKCRLQVEYPIGESQNLFRKSLKFSNFKKKCDFQKNENFRDVKKSWWYDSAKN